jgi:hypothetical protein
MVRTREEQFLIWIDGPLRVPAEFSELRLSGRELGNT